MSIVAVLAAWVLAAAISDAAAPGYHLVPSSMFIVVPNTASTVRFNATLLPPSPTPAPAIPSSLQLHFTFVDFRGQAWGVPATGAVAAAVVTVELEFPVGFYEITCAETNQSFGVQGLRHHFGPS